MADISLRTRVVEAVAEEAKAACLPLIGDQVYVRKSEREMGTANQRFPCVEVWRPVAPDAEQGMSFTYDSPGYAVQVLFKVTGEAVGPNTDTDYPELWYQMLARRLRDVRVIRDRMGTAEVWGVRVRPLPVIDQVPQVYGGVVGGLVLVCYTFEPRGAGA